MNRVDMTIAFLYDDAHILLGMKKRGFGAGMYNGFGGKVKLGEHIRRAASREMVEESGLCPTGLIRRGALYATFEGKSDIYKIHIFSAFSSIGSLIESEEMKPEWFRHDRIPYDKMWPDDRHWLPHILDGKNVVARVHMKDMEMLRYKERVFSLG